MSDTPRTQHLLNILHNMDAQPHVKQVVREMCGQLERELIKATTELPGITLVGGTHEGPK